MNKQRHKKRRTKPKPAQANRTRPRKAELRAPWWQVLVVGLLAFLPYLGAPDNDFTNWDDEAYVLNNPVIREINAENAKAWNSQFMGNYHPLTMYSYALEYHLFDKEKNAPQAWHYILINILLHTGTSLLVYFFLLGLTRRRGLAFIAAMLFAVHTLHVESVAWISERKDVLYAFFFMLSLLFYTRYSTKKKPSALWAAYLLSLLFFLCSLLSKGQAVSLAVSIVAVDYLRKRKLNHKSILDKLPYLALALWAGLKALGSQQDAQAMTRLDSFNLFERMVIASYGFGQYLLKLLLPVHLGNFYPYPGKEDGLLPISYYFYLIVPILILVLLIWLLRKDRRLLVFGILFFIINIILVLQLIPVGNQIMADRYVYVSSIGAFLLMALAYEAASKARPRLKNVFRSAGVGYIGMLVLLTVLRVEVWADSESLWSDNVRKYPTAQVAHNNLGMVKARQKQYKKAIVHYDKALEVAPEYGRALSNRGIAKRKSGDLHGALADFNRAIELYPDFYEAIYNRGITHENLGRPDLAVADFDKALANRPNFVEGLMNRSIVRRKTGKPQGAIDDLGRAINLQPGNAYLYYLRALTFMDMNNYANAINDLNRYLQQNPGHAEAFYRRGVAKLQLKYYADAVNDLSAARKALPNRPDVVYYLGVAKAEAGQEGCAELRAAMNAGLKEARVAIEKYCK